MNTRPTAAISRQKSVGVVHGTWKNMGFCLRLEILKVSVLCILFSLGVLHFFAEGSWSFGLSFGSQTFLGMKEQNLSQ